jgi:hypothetical protein
LDAVGAVNKLLAVLAAAVLPLGYGAGTRWWQGRVITARIHALGAQVDARAAVDVCATSLPITGGSPLASWQSVGGCGAGASTGTGGGVKWIGRNVRGGLFNVECQANYVSLPYGYNYVATTLVTKSVADRWHVGVSVPYLYKYMNDPYGLDVDLSNQGLGDINLLATHRFGAIAAWTATLSLGAPTAVHDAKFRGTQLLPQERQLGHGRPTASLMLDHTQDTDWGLAVLGGTVNWRGGENELQSYRAPSASLYGYAGYILGPFTPAAGLSLTGFTGHDRTTGALQGTPLLSAAANLSLEWATDWSAILLGASFPYDYVGSAQQFGRSGGFGAWVVALGVAVAPF